MANTFKKVIDRMMWAQVAPTPNASVAGQAMCADMRNTVDRNPFAYQLASGTVLNRFNIITKAWNLIGTPALAGTFGAGTSMVFAPSLGLRGTLAAGATTTSVVISTAFPTAVGLNMLASRGGSGEYGFKIRIIGAASGKTEERWIIGNTAGTTPTITLSAALTFTPATGDAYEILSGRVFMLNAGTLAAGSWRSFETATNTFATNTQTNLPATVGTDSSIIALDEQYVPYDMKPGEGLVKGTFIYDVTSDLDALAATAATSTTLTGQATGGDAVVLINEYRNFQLRIVQDTVNPTAVGQRRAIASHTAGPSPVYTIGAAWTVTPSTSAKYVIENPNLILVRSTATTTVYTYNYAGTSYANGTTTLAADTWSTTLFGVAPAANASGGVWMQSFGIQPDTARNARHSFCYFFRGGAQTLDVLDIAGGVNGTWTAAIVYDGAVTLTTGTTGCYSPYGEEGRMFYMNVYTASAINQIFRFDVENRVMSPYTPTDFLQSGTAAVGGRMAAYAAIDGTDKYDVVLLMSHLSSVSQELIVLV
jgi:hypothetical protein